MKIIDNVKSKNMWPTTTYTFTVNNIDNEFIKDKVLEREQKGLGFRFDPIQGGGWQSNKAVSYTHLTLPTICSV